MQGSNKEKEMKFTGFAVIVAILALLTLCVLPGIVCWPYTINTWLVFVGKDPCIVWWHGLLLGFAPIIGQATIPAAIATWILILFVG